MLRRRIAAALGAALTISLLTGSPGWAKPAGDRLKPQTQTTDRDGGPVKGLGWKQNRLKSAILPKAVWPKAGVGSAQVKALGDGVSIEVLNQGARDRLLARVGTPVGTPSVKAKVSIDYNSFRYAAGGDWASRLRLWQVPECALSTPERRGCQPIPLRTSNDVSAGLVSAEVDAAAEGALPIPRHQLKAINDGAPLRASGTMVMLAAAATGSSGDFTATSLAPSSTWSAGGSSGNFAWNYPLRLPPTAAGPVPSVALNYSSSSVDGRSAATNNQPSWLGEGFDFAPGYIERRYLPCSEDMKNGALNTTKTGDQCWRSDNATMSLNGSGGELIFDANKGWHTRSEDGSKIEKITGAFNGDNNGEYWKVTAKDGTQYFFGRNSLPGQSLYTDSVNTSRVYGNHSGEPCYVTTFHNSYCDQAYRWNLDYVVDVRGNTMSYWYSKQWQKYGAKNTGSDMVPYVRESTLARIEYGTYWRTTAEHGVDQQSVSPTAQVVFDTADRCLSNCWSNGNPVKESWPDSPYDQECKMDATSCEGKYSPVFWSNKRLAKVTTKVQGQAVDSWTLTHAFPSPGDGTHAGLWLDSIVHSGHVGGTETMAPVTFEPISLPNRVLNPHNTTSNWQRISNIITETGAKVHVDYSLPNCSGAAQAHTNTERCYPVIVPDYGANPNGETLMTEWWHKYVVAHIADSDVQLAGGHQAPQVDTWYNYPETPAWRYADDDGLSKPDRRTWSQYRGYSKVETRVGPNLDKQTLTVSNYLRGMHGDRLNPTGDTKSVVVGASIGSETVYDEDQFAGMMREQTVYNGVESNPVSRKVKIPWRSGPTASRTIGGAVVESRYAGIEFEYAATALGVDGARGWRITRRQQEFDHAYGTVNWSQNDGDIDVNGDEKCAKYVYNRNLAKNLVMTVKRVTTTALRCSQTPTTVDDVMSDARSYYDGATDNNTAPKFGGITKLEQLKDWAAGVGTQWETAGETTYDDFGRVVTATDLKGNATTTAFTPAVGGPVTKVTTTSPLGWTSSVVKNPYWGSAIKTVDMNARITGEVDYDPLGRVSKVWSLGWTKADNPTTPSSEFTYFMPANRNAYSSVATKALNAKGNYVTSYQILDGLLRARQSQTISLNGDGRVVTDTLYDANGRASVSYGAHVEPGPPSGTLWWEPEWSVPTVSKTEHDRASRATVSELWAGNGIDNLVLKSRTITGYEGDLTQVTQPEGGVSTTTVQDIEGRTTALRQHKTAAGVSGAYDETRYVFNRKGQIWKTIDPANNEWVNTYDAKGRQLTAKDPDKGQTTNEYNNFNELIKSTDARSEVLAFEYDLVGRKTKVLDGLGNVRTELKYDTLYSGQTGFRGQLTQAIRYEPAGSANAYKWQVRSFDARYQPGGINIVIPAAEAGLNGTYVYGYGYSTFTGAPTSITYPETGDLPVEQVTTEYDGVTGLPKSLGTNRIGQNGTMLAAWYTSYGELSLTQRKMPGGVYVDGAIEYDDYLRRVKRITIKPETATGDVSDTHYTYNTSGTITAIEDKVAQDKQCFRYNPLNQLTSAWTPKPAVSCDTNPAVSNLAGPAAYWKDWAFDSTGGRKTEVSHTSGVDTTRAYTFPAGGAGVVRPHAVTQMTTTATGQSAVALNYQFDNAGNTVCRPHGIVTNSCATGAGSQTLTWNAEGKLTQLNVGGSTAETSVYDANGTRLVRRDAIGTTIYLPGQEIRREGTVNKGTRFYSFVGKTVGSRNGTALTWLFSDHQGTDQLSVRADTQAVSIRRQTPYGEARGSTSAWSNEKGFVGGDKDATGLTNVGARRYDTILGRFISVDPVFVSTDPAQFNGYQYGGGNPVRNSDPTGMRYLCDDGDHCRGVDNTYRNVVNKPDPSYLFCNNSCSSPSLLNQKAPPIPPDPAGQVCVGRGERQCRSTTQPAWQPSSGMSPATWDWAWESYTHRWDSEARRCARKDSCKSLPTGIPSWGIVNSIPQPKEPEPFNPIVTVGYCLIVCQSVSVTSEGIVSGAGFGCCKWGLSYGNMSAPASAQTDFGGYQYCAAYYYGACQMGGPLTEGGTWDGKAVVMGLGTGGSAGQTFAHLYTWESLDPYNAGRGR